MNARIFTLILASRTLLFGSACHAWIVPSAAAGYNSSPSKAYQSLTRAGLPKNLAHPKCLCCACADMHGGGHHCATSHSWQGGSGCCHGAFRHQLRFTSSHVIQGSYISDTAGLDQDCVACTDLWGGRQHSAATHTRRAEHSVANNNSRSCCRHWHGAVEDPTRGRQTNSTFP